MVHLLGDICPPHFCQSFIQSHCGHTLVFPWSDYSSTVGELQFDNSLFLSDYGLMFMVDYFQPYFRQGLCS